MAWNPNKPQLTDVIADSITDIRENFQALDSSRIVEMGSNSNGEYVRWENGLQVCYLPPQNVAPTVGVNTTQGLTIYRGHDMSWTFPATFNKVPMVDLPNARLLLSGRVVDYGLNAAWAGMPTTTSVEFVFESLRQYDEVTFSTFAIGRWK